MMEERIFGSIQGGLKEAFLLLAIVGLTGVPMINLSTQPVKQERSNDKKH